MSQSPVLRRVTKPPLPQAGLAGGLRCWWVSGPEPGMGPGGRFEVEDGRRERGHGRLLSKEAARGSGKFLPLGQVRPLPAASSPPLGSSVSLRAGPALVQEALLAPPTPIRLQMLVEPLPCASCGSRCRRRSRVDTVPALMRAKLRERQERKSSLSETRSDRGRAGKSGTGDVMGRRVPPGAGPGTEPGLSGWWPQVRAGTGRPRRALGVLFSEPPGSHREG